MKKKVLIFSLFGIVMFGIGVGASILLQSNQVLYKNDTTVEAALNDLYAKSNVGNALASDIKAGKTALVGGKQVTGSLTCPTCDYSNYVAKSSITSLSGTQSVGAGSSSALLNGYYNLSNYKVQCGSNSCSACNSCCSSTSYVKVFYESRTTLSKGIHSYDCGFSPSIVVILTNDTTNSNLRTWWYDDSMGNVTFAQFPGKTREIISQNSGNTSKDHIERITSNGFDFYSTGATNYYYLHFICIN